MPPRRVVLLTGSELRHAFFRMTLAAHPQINVALSICEGTEESLENRSRTAPNHSLRLAHAIDRARSEKTYFYDDCQTLNDQSHPLFCTKGDVNTDTIIARIQALSPELIVAFGCSLIRSQLLDDYAGRIINMHLGLSPYYRGSGTNFFPLLHREPEYIGTTFMYMDHGIDTGHIIHQVRADIRLNDTIHDIGHRLIKRSVTVLSELITSFDRIAPIAPSFQETPRRFYRRTDFTEDSVVNYQAALASGVLEEYLNDMTIGKRHVVLAKQLWMKESRE